MIGTIEKSGGNFALDQDTSRYIDRKIGRLDHFLPRHARRSVHIEVRLQETKNKSGDNYSCEVVLHLPDRQVAAMQAASTMLAAVDIVEAKLKNQLNKYKALHASGRIRPRTVLKFFSRQSGASE